MVKTSWKDASRSHNPESEHEAGYTLSTEQLQVGSLMRIADGVEKLALSREKLEADVKYWKEYAGRLEERLRVRDNTIRGIRSRVTMLKRKIKS